MAQAPLRRCSFPSCRELVREARCPKHKSTPAHGGKRDQWCSNRRWRKLRDAFIAANPLCVQCQARGKIAAAEHIHHVQARRDRPDLAYEWDNLSALCASCHSQATAAERKDRGGGHV